MDVITRGWQVQRGLDEATHCSGGMCIALALPLTMDSPQLIPFIRTTWQAAEKRRLPGEKELHARMRVFARYMPQAEHDDLVDALVLEQRLQHRIQARNPHLTLALPYLYVTIDSNPYRKQSCRVLYQPAPCPSLAA